MSLKVEDLFLVLIYFMAKYSLLCYQLQIYFFFRVVTHNPQYKVQRLHISIKVFFAN